MMQSINFFFWSVTCRQSGRANVVRPFCLLPWLSASGSSRISHDLLLLDLDGKEMMPNPNRGGESKHSLIQCRIHIWQNVWCWNKQNRSFLGHNNLKIKEKADAKKKHVFWRSSKKTVCVNHNEELIPKYLLVSLYYSSVIQLDQLQTGVINGLCYYYLLFLVKRRSVIKKYYKKNPEISVAL